jgi:hypothetical protein
LGDEALAGVIVGLALPTALVFGLVAADRTSVSSIDAQNEVNLPVVRAVLHELGERLRNPRVSNLRFRFHSEASCYRLHVQNLEINRTYHLGRVVSSQVSRSCCCVERMELFVGQGFRLRSPAKTSKATQIPTSYNVRAQRHNVTT